MRTCHYPRPRDTQAVLDWDRYGWDFRGHHKEFHRSLKSTIARIGLPDQYEEMRRVTVYGRRAEPSELLLPALIGILRLHGYITRGSSGEWEQVPLTARQLHCVRLLAEGHLYDQIGSQLGISQKTVGDIVRTAVREIGARRPSHLVAVAYQWSWLPNLAETRKIKIHLGRDAVAPGYLTVADRGTTT